MSWVIGGMVLFIALLWWSLMLACRQIDELEEELVEVKDVSADTMREAKVMAETAEANHRYANHLLRVARDHELKAKAYLKAARKNRGQS